MIIGARALFLDEELRTIAYDDLNDFLGADDEVDDASVDTENRFVGVQLGLQGFVDVTQNIKLGGSLKGASAPISSMSKPVSSIVTTKSA